MQFKLLKLFTVFLLFFGIIRIQAQEVINAIGGNSLGSGGTVSYSVGQVTYQTNNGEGGSVIEGVQQPYIIAIIDGLNVSGISLNISAYPNPTTDYLVLELNEFDVSNLSYQLYNMQGKLFRKEEIINNETRIVMDNLTSAIYLLKIFQENKEVKTFQIIKN